jgi:hypothetical protein
MSSGSDERSLDPDKITLYSYVRSSDSDGFVQTLSRGVQTPPLSAMKILFLYKNVTKS